MISEKTLKSLRIQAYAEGKTMNVFQPTVELLHLNMLIETEKYQIEHHHRAIKAREDVIAQFRARADGYQQVLAERNK